MTIILPFLLALSSSASLTVTQEDTKAPLIQNGGNVERDINDLSINSPLSSTSGTEAVGTEAVGTQSSPAITNEPVQTCDAEGACIINYPAAFFSRYNPVTALDMVANVPGFQVDDGDGSRGFAGSAGNVLINSERPATKSESASDILSRIPASSVQQIDLIRGQTGGLDLRGQSVAINVILSTDSKNAITYEFSQNARLDAVGFFPFGRASYTDRSGAFTYTLGAEAERFRRRFAGPEELLDGAGNLLEFRDEFFQADGFRGELNLNGQYKAGVNIFRFNGSISYEEQDGGEVSQRIPTNQDPLFFLLQGNNRTGFSVETGAEFERPIGKDISAKIIGLYRRNDSGNGGSLASGPLQEDVFLSSVTDNDSLNTETILRTEIDYSGINGHLLEFSAEGAINRLDSAFSLLVDSDDGLGLVLINVAGAITQVEERRGDFSLSDSFKVGPIALDAVFAAEVSNIEQTGGFAADRSFFFIKPSLTATYAPNKQLQFRARALREIGQLNFFDFVSSTDLGDNELALGNPDLNPETTWTIDTTVERRFGDIGAISITGFYNFISDVSDVLPIGAGLEVPGNIGSGIRRGASAEITLPLDRLGLSNSRLDVAGRYQNSEVTDPVTGGIRRLSNERLWRIDVDFRQDIVAQKWAWGFDGTIRGDELAFGLDELDNNIRRPDLDAFIETTRVKGVKIRLEMGNVLNEGFDRERTVFLTERGSSDVNFQEIRERNIGRRLSLSISGNF